MRQQASDDVNRTSNDHRSFLHSAGWLGAGVGRLLGWPVSMTRFDGERFSASSVLAFQLHFAGGIENSLSRKKCKALQSFPKETIASRHSWDVEQDCWQEKPGLSTKPGRLYCYYRRVRSF